MHLDRIQLNDLEIACIIGVNPEERTQSQKIFVSLELHVDTSAAAHSDSLESTVDYEFVAAQAQFLLHLGQFFLLETACHALCRTLLLAPVAGEHRPRIEHVKVRIRKPEGLRGRAVPSLQIERSTSDVEYGVQARPLGNAQVVLETPNLGVYRTIIRPGETLPLHLHPNLDEAEMLLTEGLDIQGEPGKRGSIRLWPKGTAHTYQNSTNRCQSLLSLCRPHLRDSDLVLVNGRATPVAIYSPSELGTRQLNSAWPVLA
jgi:dihydroneopterin aldolase